MRRSRSSNPPATRRSRWARSSSRPGTASVRWSTHLSPSTRARPKAKGTCSSSMTSNPAPNFPKPPSTSSTPAVPTSTRCRVGPSARPGGETWSPIFGEPSGVAVDPGSGELYVTTGNSERVRTSSSTAPSNRLPRPLSSPGDEGSSGVARGRRLGARERAPARLDRTARAQQRIRFRGRTAPRRCGSASTASSPRSALPRHGTAPVGIVVDARISATGAAGPAAAAADHDRDQPQRTLRLHGPAGLPGRPDPALDHRRCPRACRGSLVGEGRFSANVKLPEQSPFPPPARSSPSTAGSTASRRSSPTSTAPSRRRPRPSCPSCSRRATAPTARP